MKLLLIADLHTCPKTDEIKTILKTEDYDVLINLGDNDEFDLNNIKESRRDTDFIGVLGNHDTRLLRRHFLDLHGRTFKETKDDETLSFLGVEGCYRYKDEGTDEPMHLDIEIRAMLQKLEAVDCIISHAPYFTQGYDTEYKKGFYSINEYIIKNKPKYMFFGHLHEPSDKTFFKTRCICVYGIASFDTKTGELKSLLKP